ncbi:MAG: TldD/PmbA family protein [Candidatus Lokiarchaeota archaeon]|nr:TldD/PmbA family protein [Candidatus Lokiarchaeota archaeon]
MQSEPNLDLPVDDAYHKQLQKLKKKYNIEYYNARFNIATSTIIHINKGKMKQNNNHYDYGCSIQTFVNGGYGFASSNEISLSEIERMFEKSVKLAQWSSSRAGKKFHMKSYDPLVVSYEQPQKRNLFDVSNEDKIFFLLQQDKAASTYDARIVNTNSYYMDNVSRTIISTSDNRIVDNIESHVRIRILTNSKEETNLQEGKKSMGISGGFEIIDKANNLGLEAAEEAIENLNAKPVKGGQYNIIADPYLSGTFIHEAFGHACEADGVLAGESQLAGRIGERMGNKTINVIDDPTMEGEYGFVKYDSEAMEARKVQLIKEGFLNGFMHNRETASKMDVEPTGNGRASSFSSIPVVRMRTTFIEPGDWSLEEMMEDLKNGILCVSWNYGYTEPSIGQFMFKMARAWEVQNGEKVQLLRDAALSGMMLDILNNISAVGKEKLLDDGTCGKANQHVPVSSGSPYIRINNVVIGGL